MDPILSFHMCKLHRDQWMIVPDEDALTPILKEMAPGMEKKLISKNAKKLLNSQKIHTIFTMILKIMEIVEMHKVKFSTEKSSQR